MDGLVERLRAGGFVAAEAEAAELIAAFGATGAALDAAVARRETGEPLAWVVGSTLFAGRRFHVAPGVYVPRPRTEDLARLALDLLPGRGLDLATGCGALAAVLGPGTVGVDIDPVAVRCARANGVTATVGDLAAPPVRPGSFDLVAAVAPYVPTDALRLLPRDVRAHEPRRALDGGTDGLDALRAVVEVASWALAAGGAVAIELGGDQDDLLAPALATAGFAEVRSHHDAEGDLRALTARLTR